MISPAVQAAQWSRRLLVVALVLFVLGVLLGSVIGAEGFLFGAVIWLPVWLCSMIIALIALRQSSYSEAGWRIRRSVLETILSLLVMLLTGIAIAFLTDVLDLRVGLS